MDGTLKILLLAALTLLVSAKTFDNYRSLPDKLRTHTDKALKKANENFGSGYHVAFHSIKEPVEPMIDCVVCKTQDGEELVDCARAVQKFPHCGTN
ncbi:hypothetical protein C0J50_3151 [Silurus asotus]|uniref:Uncharacterized protein n=1 Tax=Silurus asotus TaxID=30991 RepID=A0AAD5B4Y3_SILAS|nr:hypothetical protein C0J50_3151 [Silurus asotus]